MGDALILKDGDGEGTLVGTLLGVKDSENDGFTLGLMDGFDVGDRASSNSSSISSLFQVGFISPSPP